MNYCKADLDRLIAVTGLAGRAFGSWQAGNGSMWLRDFLPKNVPGLRTYVYGYPSILFKSQSTASLSDFTNSFMDDLKAYLNTFESVSVRLEKPHIISH
jgi:hypothetical protein